MDEKLKCVFANVNEWLKFAEAKNAVLVALNGAAAFSALSLLSDQPSFGVVLLAYLYLFMFFALAGLTVALFSFLPQTKIPEFWSTGCPKETDNLLFYGDICKYDPEGCLKAMSEAYGKEECNLSKMEADYVNQIVVNSKIAIRKYNYFRVALWLTLSALVTPLVGGILYLFFDPNTKQQ